MEARAAWDEAKRNLAADIDPSVVKRERRRAAKIATDNTFETVAREWHENWKGARSSYLVAMAIYHLHVKVISRKSGSSAVASAAYRSDSRLRDERLDRDQDFSAKRGVVHSEVMLPENAPGRA